MRIGVIGTGMLGNAVVLHLLDSGFDVSVFNRTREKAAHAQGRGAKLMDSPKAVAQSSGIVIIAVRDANAVRQVSFEKDGIIEGNHNGLVVADMSTIDPSESRDISKTFSDHSIKKLDIPVMGGPNVAITGNLVMMVSGDRGCFESFKNVFEVIANKVFFLGDSGTAHTVKLAMNLQITMLALALSEGITFVKKANVSPKTFLEILNSTYFKTGMSENKAYKMADGKYEATFTLANLKKDISTIVEAATSLGAVLPMAKKAESVYEDAVNSGLGDIDYTGIIEHIRRINLQEDNDAKKHMERKEI